MARLSLPYSSNATAAAGAHVWPSAERKSIFEQRQAAGVRVIFINQYISEPSSGIGNGVNAVVITGKTKRNQWRYQQRRSEPDIAALRVKTVRNAPHLSR
jgi:hypothetical protein